VPNVQWKTPDDGQRNCPKDVEFLDKNKFGKLVRLLVLLKRNNFYFGRSPTPEPIEIHRLMNNGQECCKRVGKTRSAAKSVPPEYKIELSVIR
jgi:hypothetical protein